MTTRSPGLARARSSEVIAFTTSGAAVTPAGSTSQPSRAPGDPGDGLGEPERVRIPVAGVVQLDRLGERDLHRRRQREVHLGDEGGEDVLVVEAPLGAAAEAAGR